MTKKNGTHDLDVTIQCPACHEYGVFHTWDVIDTADAKLSERVHFDENLFFYTCPHCHAKIHMESKCLYIDRDKKLLVWHIPDPGFAVLHDLHLPGRPDLGRMAGKDHRTGKFL